MTDPTSQSPDAVVENLLRQRAWLLDQIARAADQKLKRGEANRAIPASLKRTLGLDAATASRCRAEMVSEGLLGTEREKRVESFHLTDRGRAYLEQHRQAIPALPARRGRGIAPPSNPDVQKFRVSYLLLQLLEADGQTRSQTEANKFGAIRDRLELNAATAKAIRHELAEQGFLTIVPHGRSEAYTLTAAGRLQLGTLAFDGDFEFKLKGRVLNELLEAAREAAREFTAAPAEGDRLPVTVPSEAVAPSAVQLEEAVLRAFDELLRERHTVAGMVPIHEVREEVRKQLGESAARHDVFDRAILGWWQAGRLRLVPITDGTKASLEQLQASIPGTGETLFFLESAHESVAR